MVIVLYVIFSCFIYFGFGSLCFLIFFIRFNNFRRIIYFIIIYVDNFRRIIENFRNVNVMCKCLMYGRRLFVFYFFLEFCFGFLVKVSVFIRVFSL